MSQTQFTEREADALNQVRVWPNLIILPAVVVGFAALVLGWPSTQIGWRIFWVVMTTYPLLCWGSLLHETAHQTLGSSRRFNIWLGKIIGTLTFVPYSVYRETHIRHHAYLNRPNDWELWPYSDPTKSRTFRRWFVWLDLICGIAVTPYIYSRIVWHRDSPITSPAVRRSIRREYWAMLAVWLSALTAIVVAFQWVPRENWTFWWLVPALAAGSLQVVRKFTEHLGMASYDPLQGARTVIGTNWLTRLNSFFSLDIIVHGPHHRHPKLTHLELADRMRRYHAQPDAAPYPLFPTYAAAVRHMLPALLWNPGVGMNAGAPAPPCTTRSDCSEFVADVTTELHTQDAVSAR
jgi:fatty acid desaturase